VVPPGLDLVINVSVKNVSRHRNGKMKLIIETRGSTALSCDEAYSPHAKAVKVELPLGRTTLTAANGEYDEESGRAVVTTPRHSEIGYRGFPL